MSRRSTRTQNEWNVEITGLAMDSPPTSVDALDHLGRSFVGERHREDRFGHHAHVLDQVSNPVGDDTCLPAARAGEDQHRAVGGFDGFALLRVESGRRKDNEKPRASS